MNTNNFSIGVDIEKISRFRYLTRKKNAKFLDKIFTKKELDYCFSKKPPAQHLAVRFAAKEAIVKAISSLNKRIFPFDEIEIIGNTSGIPAADLKGYNIKISLSHCEGMAIAFTVIEEK